MLVASTYRHYMHHVQRITTSTRNSAYTHPPPTRAVSVCLQLTCFTVFSTAFGPPGFAQVHVITLRNTWTRWTSGNITKRITWKIKTFGLREKASSNVHIVYFVYSCILKLFHLSWILFLDVQILCSHITSASKDNDDVVNSLPIYSHQWNFTTKLAKLYLR